MRLSRHLVPLLGLCAVALVGSEAMASTITQNMSWTIDRAGTTTKYRVTAYGDSIYAGYRGSLSSVAQARRAVGRRRVPVASCGTPTSRSSAAPSRARWRPTSTTTRSSPSARTCRPPTPASSRSRCAATTACRRAAASPARAAPATTAPLNTALANCTTYQQSAMQYINTNATRARKLKVVSNLYYPGYAADNALSSCTDSGDRAEGQQAEHVPALHRAHELARLQLRQHRTASRAPTASRSTWAPTTTRTATARSTPTRSATCRASRRRPT